MTLFLGYHAGKTPSSIAACLSKLEHSDFSCFLNISNRCSLFLVKENVGDQILSGLYIRNIEGVSSQQTLQCWLDA